MHKKRDRMVVLHLHRSSGNVLLFPYVYFMGGEAWAYGDAIELIAPVDPAIIGKHVVHLLRACKKADIDAMKNRRMEELRSYWRGESVAKEKVHGEAWNQLLAKYLLWQRVPAPTFVRSTYVRSSSAMAGTIASLYVSSSQSIVAAQLTARLSVFL